MRAFSQAVCLHSHNLAVLAGGSLTWACSVLLALPQDVLAPELEVTQARGHGMPILNDCTEHPQLLTGGC